MINEPTKPCKFYLIKPRYCRHSLISTHKLFFSIEKEEERENLNSSIYPVKEKDESKRNSPLLFYL